MIRNSSKRRSMRPMLDGLESRCVLSAALPAHLAAEVRGFLSSLVPAIKGTIHGTVTSVTPISASSELVTFTGRGKANIIGDGRGTGHHTITSKILKNKATNDTYSHGSVTVTGSTDTVAVRYTGSGHTNANGSFTATIRGTATSVAGQHAGLSGSFVAQLSGTSRTGPFTVNFTIKV